MSDPLLFRVLALAQDGLKQGQVGATLDALSRIQTIIHEALREPPMPKIPEKSEPKNDAPKSYLVSYRYDDPSDADSVITMIESPFTLEDAVARAEKLAEDVDNYGITVSKVVGSMKSVFVPESS